MIRNGLGKAALISVILSSCLFAKETNKLDSIIVTANKIEENIEDIPQSISIIDDVTIEDRGISDIEDFVKLIPNMSITTDSGRTVNFRGLNSSKFTNTNPVAIYVDGIPSTDKYGYDLYLENVERIEVLRGPQGTLYGKNAIGGVINIITKKPTDITQGNATVEYGSNNYNSGKINISGPIIENTLYYTLNGKMEKDDGWITNNHPGMNKNANRKENNIFKGSLHYKNDNLSSKLTISNSKNKRYWLNGYSLPIQDFTRVKDFNRDDAENVAFDTKTLEETNINSQSLNIKYEFKNFTFDSITTNKKLVYNGIDDLDYGALPINSKNVFYDDTVTKTVSQEFRLASSSKNNLKWVSGLFLEKEDREQGPYGLNFYTINTNSDSSTKTKTYAAFSQVMIPFNDFEVTLGARYQKIKKDFDLLTNTTITSDTGKIVLPYSIDTDKTWNNFIPRFGLTYKLNENITPFLSISKGYLPGGFNYVGDKGALKDNTFKPQKSTNYELGFKSIFEDFILSASVFKMDIEDIHVYKIIGTSVSTSNAKKAHSQGIEIEGTYFINDNFELSASAGFIDAKYDDYFDGERFDGETIRRTPKHTASISLSYKNPNGFYSILDVNSQGATQLYNRDTKKQIEIDGHITSNLKIGYKYKDWDLYAYAVNLTDEKYLTSFNVPPVSYTPEFGDPRKFGLGLKYTF